MKQLFAILLISFFAVSVVFAQNQNSVTGSNNSAGSADGQQLQTQNQVQAQEQIQGQDQTQNQEQVQQQTQNQGEDQGLLISNQQQAGEAVINAVRERIQLKKQQLSQELQSLKGVEQKVYQNQNQVRAAVHSLLELKDVVGGIGPQVSAIAQDFNNSIQSTLKAEEKIQSRNRIIKFFAGGDEDAAEAIKQEISKNQERIQQLKQLKEQCDCEEEIQNMFQEQLQNMDQEQTRLQELVQTELQQKGLFGRIIGWFQGFGK